MCDTSSYSKRLVELLNAEPQDSNSKSPEFYVEEGDQFAKIKQFGPALNAYTKALTISELQKPPMVITCIERLGHLYLLEKQFDMATRLYACAAALNASDKIKVLENFTQMKTTEQQFLEHHKLQHTKTKLMKKLNNYRTILSGLSFVCEDYRCKAVAIVSNVCDVVLCLNRMGHQYLQDLLQSLEKACTTKTNDDFAKELEGIVYFSKLVLRWDLTNIIVIQEYRSTLSESRKLIMNKLQEGQTAQVLGVTTTSILKNCFCQIISDCIHQFPTPPCQFAFLGLGSMARDEMCPYSDIEFALLLSNTGNKKKYTQNFNYFKNMCKLIELKIIQLGETPLSVLDHGKKSPIPRGFMLDIGGNTPLSELLPLLGFPEDLAQFQQPQFFNSSLITANACRDVCYLFGDITLYKEYIHHINIILSSKSDTEFPAACRMFQRIDILGGMMEFIIPMDCLEKDPNDDTKYVVNAKGDGVIKRPCPKPLARVLESDRGGSIMQVPHEHLTVRQNYGFLLGKAALQDFSPELQTKVLLHEECVAVKRELYRFPCQMVAVLALYFQIPEVNYWQRCDALLKNGHLSKKNYELLTKIMYDVMVLRYSTQLWYEEEEESIYLRLGKTDKLTKKKFLAQSHHLNMLKQIYQLLYPIHDLLESFVSYRIDGWILKKDIFSPYNFAEEGDRLVELRRISAAAVEYRKEIALTPEGEASMVLQKKLTDVESFSNGIVNSMKDVITKLKNTKPYEDVDKLLSKDFTTTFSNYLTSKLGISINTTVLCGVDQTESTFYYYCLCAPFSSIVTFISALIHNGVHAIAWEFFMFILHLKLESHLPIDVKISWSYSFVLFFERLGNYNAMSLFVDNLCTLPIDDERHPSLGVLISSSRHQAQEKNISKARQYLDFAEKKCEWLSQQPTVSKEDSLLPLTDNTLMSKSQKVIILDGRAQVSFWEGRLEEGNQFLLGAVELAQQITHNSLPILIQKQKFVNELKERGFSTEQCCLDNTCVLFEQLEDSREKLDSLVKDKSSIMALPYAKQLLALDPANMELQTQVQALEIISSLHDLVCSKVVSFFNNLEKYKDWDCKVRSQQASYLHNNPKYSQINQLANTAPARFHLAYFSAFFSCYSEKVPFVLSILEKEIAHLYTVFNNHLPKFFEIETLYNFGIIYLGLDMFDKAEESLTKSLEIYMNNEPYEPSVDYLLPLYIEFGRLYKNTKRLNKAKELYGNAIETLVTLRKKGKCGKFEDMQEILLLDGVCIVAFMENDLEQASKFFSKLLLHPYVNRDHCIPKLKELTGKLLHRFMVEPLVVVMDALKIKLKQDPLFLESEPGLYSNVVVALVYKSITEDEGKHFQAHAKLILPLVFVSLMSTEIKRDLTILMCAHKNGSFTDQVIRICAEIGVEIVINKT